MKLNRPFLARLLSLILATCFALDSSARAAVWQWSVPITSVVSSETQDHPRAFLWIPPNCKQVRGVVVGQHNMEEETIFENPLFRKAMAELNFAIVWVTPPWDLFFRFDRGSRASFDEMMDALARESGYAELATAPVVPTGHSAAASFPWNFAALDPARTLAVVSVSGQWPYYIDQNTPDWAGRNVDGVPGLVAMGEYEAAETRAGTGLQQRAEHPHTALTMLAEPGAGHFDVSDAKAAYLGYYIKKAAQYRLPADSGAKGQPVKLKPIDPTKEGWLADRWHQNKGPDAPAAPVGKYTGDTKNAFWFFDEDHVRVTEDLQARFRGTKPQLAGYVQDGAVATLNPKLHEKVRLKFTPLPDGVSFKLSGTFWDTAPEGSPYPTGTPLTHSTNGEVEIVRICGPAIKTGPDTWQIAFNRVGTTNAKRANTIVFAATHPGDDAFRRTIQQAYLSFPLRNTAGADQKITFPAIPDQKVGAAPIKLQATSDSGEPVGYYVREGPAEIDGNVLKLTEIPPGAKYPVKVTVVAWQWGRSIEPRLKTADPVEQTFSITR